MMRRFFAIGLALSLALAGTVPASAQSPQAQQSARPRPDFEAGEMARSEWPREAVRAPKAMVVSDTEQASQAGVEILKKGGNAVDAAVAVGFALAVTWPAAGNLGGGGFMLVRMADSRTGFVDYRETAPAKSSRGMYIQPDGSAEPGGSTLGYRAVGIPGTVAGMELALKTYGTMKLAEVMAPAIRLADQGFPVDEKLARSLAAGRTRMQRFSVSRKIFLNNGTPYKAGDTFRQPALAQTLRRIARGGVKEYYQGRLGRELAEEITRMGGLISPEDMVGYRAKIREPLRARYTVDGAEWEIISAPPPSSGGTAMIQALNILAPVPLRDWTDAKSVHWVVEAMRRVFADRAEYMADADFAKVPVKGLTDPRYAEELRKTIDAERASTSTAVRAGNPAPYEGSETTHYSVVDAAGNAVANTYTINDSYGAAVSASHGYLLNNTMDDFTTLPGKPNLFGLLQSESNTIAPGKRPLSSMTPTILLRDHKLSFVTGSPGGPRIISAVLLSVLNWMRLGAHAQAAINAPRFHHQWMPDELRVEDTLPLELRAALERMGHKVLPRSWIGQVEAIAIDAKTGERLGAADPRRQGAAAGY